MKDYLFRGKTNSKEWVYGNFVKAQNGETAIIDSQDVIHEVSPETVRQYSGIDDILGVKIFEGDRVQNIRGRKYIVAFKNGSFILLYANVKDEDGDLLRWGLLSRAFEIEKFEIEVVGNIHDEEVNDET